MGVGVFNAYLCVYVCVFKASVCVCGGSEKGYKCQKCVRELSEVKNGGRY